MQNSIANYGDFEAKYLQWPSLSQRDSYITVQFHLWPVQIIKKIFGTCYFLFADRAQILHILHKIKV